MVHVGGNDRATGGDFLADEFGRDDGAVIEPRAEADAGMLMTQVRLRDSCR